MIIDRRDLNLHISSRDLENRGSASEEIAEQTTDGLLL
jgi:hypothetical protein